MTIPQRVRGKREKKRKRAGGSKKKREKIGWWKWLWQVEASEKQINASKRIEFKMTSNDWTNLIYEVNLFFLCRIYFFFVLNISPDFLDKTFFVSRWSTHKLIHTHHSCIRQQRQETDREREKIALNFTGGIKLFRPDEFCFSKQHLIWSKPTINVVGWMKIIGEKEREEWTGTNRQQHEKKNLLTNNLSLNDVNAYITYSM